MGILAVLNPIKAILGTAGDIVDSLHTSTEEKLIAKAELMKIEFEVERALLEADTSIARERASVIKAEIASKSRIASAWRPITMLAFVLIIVNNYIFVPYAVSFGLNVPMLEIPPGMWGLLTVGIGGYVAARTYEKKLGIDREQGDLR